MTETPYNPHEDPDLNDKPQDNDATAPSDPATENDDGNGHNDDAPPSDEDEEEGPADRGP